ncbi:vpu protein [Simian immunodeficiency virus]|uniref:Vpu protein n=1 Tax=Simian immunodeficiency virus TaxID=11723 RepID=Q8JAG6_SIV|nr:vpu protein [Simian immunodeficiency virus]
MHPAAVWWWGAAIITFIYLCVALLALYLAWDKWVKGKPKPTQVAVIRLIEDEEDSGIYDDASSELTGFNGFANPGFEV